MVQRRAARFVSGNYRRQASVGPCSSHLYWRPYNKGGDRRKRWWCTRSSTTLLPLTHHPFFICRTLLQEANAWGFYNHTAEHRHWGNHSSPQPSTSGTSLQPLWLPCPPWRASRPEMLPPASKPPVLPVNNFKSAYYPPSLMYIFTIVRLCQQ